MQLRPRLPRVPKFFAFVAGLFTSATLALGAAATPSSSPSATPTSLTLASGPNSLTWEKSAEGWKLTSITASGAPLRRPAGYYTILHSGWGPNMSRVEANVEGTCFTFYPESAEREADGGLVFRQSLRVADVVAHWRPEPSSGDVLVTIEVEAKVKGFVSIASPTLAIVDHDNLAWGMVPGNWYGTSLQPNYELAFRYSQGLPMVPTLARERTTMTLCSLLTTKDGVTFAVAANPGTAADPWAKDKYTRTETDIGLAALDHHNELTPIIYSPVLGEAHSAVAVGEKKSLGFHYVISKGDWHAPFVHIVNDIYAFNSLLPLQKNEISLSDRLRRLEAHVDNPAKNNWSTWDEDGLTVGANGSKNADIGTMLLLAKAGDDKVLQAQIPYVRNYKLAQQEMKPGFFQYAATGEYGGKDGFNSEVGNWVEPMFTTQYIMQDVGNLLLFHPDDPELRERMRLAAEKLIAWQHPDGSWDVAYDRFSHKLTFPMLTDYRATWYGLLIAYKTLGDKRYLAAAEKGAAWFIANGVNKGYYLGVCGDARDIWDFATAASAQAFMDLYDTTGKPAYKDAAIASAWIYATAIFTHPINTGAPRTVKDKEVADWQIEQTGLGVEHIRGTAAGSGPILITSFCGMFIRAYEMTKEPLFLNMARAAAHGRSAFVEPESGVSIYYWMDLDRVKERVKAVPHHAYWQMGWIADYLMSEAKVRSAGQVQFPHGFMTPKVGPHVSYGFAPGTIYGQKASLLIRSGLVACEDQDVEYVTALSEDKKTLFVMAYNQSTTEKSATLALAPDQAGLHADFTHIKPLQGDLTLSPTGSGKSDTPATLPLRLPAWGLGVYAIPVTASN